MTRRASSPMVDEEIQKIQLFMTSPSGKGRVLAGKKTSPWLALEKARFKLDSFIPVMQ
ncbi:hypothetical protein SD208_03235 [Ochrobactrum sp. BD67]